MLKLEPAHMTEDAEGCSYWSVRSMFGFYNTDRFPFSDPGNKTYVQTDITVAKAVDRIENRLGLMLKKPLSTPMSRAVSEHYQDQGATSYMQAGPVADISDHTRGSTPRIETVQTFLAEADLSLADLSTVSSAQVANLFVELGVTSTRLQLHILKAISAVEQGDPVC